MKSFRVLLSLLSIATITVGFAQSDVPVVPPEFYDGWRRVGGDDVTFCIDTSSTTVEFERQAAAAIAEALLLEYAFFEVDLSYSINAEGFLSDLFIWLTDECDAFMGFSLHSNTLPSWLTITRPYASFRYVVVVANPDIRSLAEVPVDELIGAQMVSAGDRDLIAFLQARQEASRWQRIPYADNALMLQRLLDGTIGAMLIWEPTLYSLTGGDPRSAGAFIIDPEPFHETRVAVGMVLRQQEAFVREQIDAAIAALVEDGTFDSILERTAIPGRGGGID